MTTIRKHAEAIRDRHRDCGNCEHGFLCPEVEHAQAILDALDGCGRYYVQHAEGQCRYALVPDPRVACEPVQYVPHEPPPTRQLEDVPPPEEAS